MGKENPIPFLESEEIKMNKKIFFGAGRAFDGFGRATSYWTGVVVYKWDTLKQVFHVYAIQVLGTGTANNSYETETEITSCEEVNKLLDYFKELEAHYKKVYE